QGAPGSSGEGLRAVLQHADSAFREGDYQEAQTAYEEVLRIAPGDRRAAANLAACYFRARKEKQAEALLDDHLERYPDDVAARLLLARVMIRQGELERAAAALRAAVAVEPDSLMGRYNLGFVAYRLRLYDEALEQLQKTIELQPDHPEAFYTQGLVLLAQGKVDEAIVALERAVAIDPRHTGARFNLASANARAGRMQEAQRHQAIFSELSGLSDRAATEETQIKSSSLKAVQSLLDRKYPEALTEYRALVAEYPDYAPLHNAIGMILMRLGRRDEAMEALQRAASLDPRLGEPHYLMAALYAEMGDAQSAERERQIFDTLESIPEKPSY
ncbi:MAG TPA: tetratricopeptide repeat protein, partial [Candidatus Polarisedimenticolia bacterium]|nr:tetratricopeptide repeat protein [Candidatus Polarisedimenticolia bacterium]